jgi:16S rRNA (guanine(1405)-N(7))-methyltransferase
MVDDAQGAQGAQIDAVMTKVLASGKYRQILPNLVRAIVRRELAAGRTPKEADKATRSKLHQVAASYLGGRMWYDAWLAEIVAARQESEEALRRALREVMGRHASTRERLPVLDAFYATTLEGIEPPRSVLDVACGLNPLAIPWMPLAPGARYTACDVFRDLMAFLEPVMGLLGVRGIAAWRDVVGDPPDDEVDLALLLKAIPCLEQLDTKAGRRLLDELNARHLLVSFTVASLGGRDRGMIAHYDAHMRALTAERPWRVKRFLFETELVFLVRK